jgi:hypothetical protein
MGVRLKGDQLVEEELVGDFGAGPVVADSGVGDVSLGPTAFVGPDGDIPLASFGVVHVVEDALLPPELRSFQVAVAGGGESLVDVRYGGPVLVGDAVGAASGSGGLVGRHLFGVEGIGYACGGDHPAEAPVEGGMGGVEGGKDLAAVPHVGKGVAEEAADVTLAAVLREAGDGGDATQRHGRAVDPHGEGIDAQAGGHFAVIVEGEGAGHLYHVLEAPAGLLRAVAGEGVGDDEVKAFGLVVAWGSDLDRHGGSIIGRCVR